MTSHMFGKIRKIGTSMVGGVVATLCYGILTENGRIQKTYPNQRGIYVSTPEKFKEILKENVRNMFRNLNKSDLLLRNGDLVFIRYNLNKLGRFDRYRLILSRRFSMNRIYDDLGIVYSKGNDLFIILLPSINLKSSQELEEFGIKKEQSNGVIAVEYDDLIEENCPHLLSIRRLICSDSVRERVMDSLKSAVTELESSINSNIMSVFNNRNDPTVFGITCSTFSDTLTSLDELKFTKKSLELNSITVLNALFSENDFDSRKYLTKQKSNEKYNLVIEPKEAIRHIDNLISLENLIKVCEKEANNHNMKLGRFLKRAEFGKDIAKANTLSTETSLVSRVYAKSCLLPFREELGMFNITHYLQLDALCDLDSESRSLSNTSRLSSLFHAFTGEINEERLKNLEYEPLCNSLEYYYWTNSL
ncbi:conserved hypothetical protein [Theileria equi strain WA]|uniref:Uncharacterized protein n=1 Tax=Theileria equi strain WA TaxID=1537102 RepID=L1LCE4_THEEQ|nr:conserved hypothetical protein [Theileria equi strain WA]EKX72949.1 conserved hypothetical protein [Theileria equi strain WA]|eukprot:XP_004832401.1 conserved hypothetical protein [Theileria equi strain WA]